MARTLWILVKDGHVMTCTVTGDPGREELQVLIDREVYLSELHTVPEGTINRATLLHRGFEARGWTEASEAGDSPDPATPRSTT